MPKKKSRVNKNTIQTDNKSVRALFPVNNHMFKWAVRSDITDFDWDNKNFVFSTKDALKLKPLLDSYTSMTWNQVINKKHNHSWDIGKLCKDIISRFACKFSSDLNYETLYQISLSNAHRIIGIKEDNIFYILWNDPNHKAYPTQKDS